MLPQVHRAIEDAGPWQQRAAFDAWVGFATNTTRGPDPIQRWLYLHVTDQHRVPGHSMLPAPLRPASQKVRVQRCGTGNLKAGTFGLVTALY